MQTLTIENVSKIREEIKVLRRSLTVEFDDLPLCDNDNPEDCARWDHIDNALKAIESAEREMGRLRSRLSRNVEASK